MDTEVIAKLLSPVLVALVGAVTKRYLEARPKLIFYLVHASAFPLPDQQVKNVHTHSVVVRNVGRKSAHNVRIGHGFFPRSSYQIYPALHHEVLAGPNDSAEILIPTLVPQEQVSLSYLYFPPVTWNQVSSYAKSDEGLARVIDVIPSPALSRWSVAGLWALIFVGASTLVYWLVMAAISWAHA